MENRKPVIISHFLITSAFWPNSISRISQLGFLWISNIHLLAIFVYIQIQAIPSSPFDSLVLYMDNFSKILVFKTVLDTQASNLKINIMFILNWIYLVLILATIGVIIVKSVMRKELSRSQKLFTFYITQFHLTIGFWGSCTFLVGSISASHSMSEPSGYYNPNLMIFYILLLVFYYAFGLVACFLSYDPFYSTNELAARNSYDQVILFVTKAFILPSVALESTPPPGILWVIVAVCFLTAVLRYFHLFKTFPYFHFLPMKISITLICLSIIISLASIIKLAAQSDRTISIVDVVYIEILLGVLIIKLSHIHLHTIMQNAQAKDNTSLGSETEVFQHLSALMHTYKGTPAYAKAHKYNLNEIKFRPVYTKYLTKNPTNHKNSNIIYENFEDTAHYNVGQEDGQEAMNKIVIQMLATAIRRIRHNNNLKIFLAQYTLQANTNLYMATSYLYEVSKSGGLNKVLATELLGDLERAVQTRYLNNEKDSVNIKSFVDFKGRSTRFTQLISSVSKLYIQFWDASLAPNLKVKNIHRISCKIENYDKIIKNIWTKEIEPHLRFASSLVDFYSSYLALVRGAPHTSHVLNKKYRNISAYHEEIAREDFPLSEENIMSPNNIVLRVSLNKTNFGKIMRASPNIVDHLEWTHTEIVDKDIHILLLPAMRNKFNDSILRDLETGSRTLIWNQTIDLYVKTKEGHMQRAYLYLAIYPTLQEGLTYLAILRFRRAQVQQIVLNREGMLEGITSGIAEKLNVSMEKAVSIEELVCKNIEETDNYDSGNTSDYVERTIKYSNILSVKAVGISRETPQKYVKMWWEANNKNIVLEFRRTLHNQQINSLQIPSTLKYNVSINSKVLFGVYFNILTLKERISGGSHYADSSPHAKSNFQVDIVKSTDSIPNEQTEQIDEEASPVRMSERLISTHTNRETNRDTNRETRELLTTKSPLIPLFTSSATLKGITLNRLKTDKTITNGAIPQSFEVISEGSLSDEISENKKKAQLKSVKDPDAMSTQSVSYSTYGAYIEKAVYIVPAQKGVTLLRILSVLCSIFCGAILIAYQLNNSSSINSIGETTLIASNWTRQLGNLATINHWILRFSLLDSGVFQNNRYTWLATPNYRKGVPSRFNASIYAIAPVLAGLRETVSDLDYSTRMKFFEKIPVFDRDNNGNRVSHRSDDLFRITDQILSCMRRIYATDPNLVHDYTPYVAFITDNTLNESLVYGEGVVNSILQAIKEKLTFMKDILICFAVIAAVANILLLCFSLSIVKTFISDRSRFLNILLRVDSKQIKEHLHLVSNLCKILEKETTRNKKLKNMTALDLFDSRVSSAQTSQTYRARPANKSGINTNLFKLAFGVLVLTIFLFAGYMTAIFTVDNQRAGLESKINLILASDLIQYHAELLYYQTFAYVGFNESTYVRELPISQSWNVSYNIVTERLLTFVDLAQTNMQSGGNQQIVQYLTGNLCNLLPAGSAAAIAYCPLGLNGQTQKGLIAVANHLMATLTTAKSTFDHSARSKADMIAALAPFDVIESGPMAYNYWFPGYGVISDLVRKEYLLTSTNFSKDGLMIIWGALYIVIGSLGWWILVLKYMEDRESWKNMVRMVPTSVITTNKMLKVYLAIHNVK